MEALAVARPEMSVESMPLERLEEYLNCERGIEIDRNTCIPRWNGDPLDLGHITTSLWCVDHREELRPQAAAA